MNVLKSNIQQNCANTVPKVNISNSNSHDVCTEGLTNVKCENLSPQQSAQRHNVLRDYLEHFTAEPGKTVRSHEIRLKPGSRHIKRSLDRNQ